MAFSFTDFIKPAIGGVAGGILGATGGLTPYNPNVAPAFRQYGQTVGGLAGMYDPYVQEGQQALQQYGGLSRRVAEDPTYNINRITSSFAESPYQQQMDRNLARMMDYNAATTGMLGSTAAQSALQRNLASQQNQFMQQYLQEALGQYGQAMGGLRGLSQLGFEGVGRQTGLRQEQALAEARAAMQPPKPRGGFVGALEGAAGGILGMLGGSTAQRGSPTPDWLTAGRQMI